MTDLSNVFQRKKWGDVSKLVVSLLNDVQGGGRLYDPAELIMWWNQSQRHLASIKPMQCSYLYIDYGNKQTPVPTNMYRPLYIISDIDGGSIVDRISLVDGMTRNKQGFFVFNRNIVFTDKARVNKNRFRLLYHGWYDDIIDDESELSVPVWAHEACAMYTAMLIVTSEAVKDSRYRKFISSNDAGNPQQNPFIPVAEWLEKRFMQVINAHSDDDVEFVEVMTL